MFASKLRRLAGFFRAFSRSQTPPEPPIAPENATRVPAPSVPQDTLVIYVVGASGTINLPVSSVDRHGHDLQVGDTVAVVGETSADNRWHICRIVDQGEFQDVYIVRWRYLFEDRRDDFGYMESHRLRNNALVFLERPTEDWRREVWALLSPHTWAWGEWVPLSSGTHLILSVHNTGTKFEFDAGQFEELTIGRKDPQTGATPDVDLDDAGAPEKGVSRNHASIIRKNDSLQIVDNGSANGTYLNGQRLVAHQPRVMRDGDEVRLGKLVLHCWFL